MVSFTYQRMGKDGEGGEMGTGDEEEE